MKWLLSPNLWAGVASVLGVLGIASLVSSTAFDIAWLKTIGFVLLSPIVLVGVLLVVVVIPVLTLANRKAAKEDSSH
jgi:tellurite resistance protein TehA-like permease